MKEDGDGSGIVIEETEIVDCDGKNILRSARDLQLLHFHSHHRQFIQNDLFNFVLLSKINSHGYMFYFSQGSLLQRMKCIIKKP